MVQIIWMVVGWRMEYEWDEGNDRERLNFDMGNKDDRGELRNLVLLLVIWFVMYRVYVWKWGRSRTINNEIKGGYYAGSLGTIREDRGI